MRFVTKDPARDDGEESAYQYCAGDPVGKVDPTGMWYLQYRHEITRDWYDRLKAVAVGPYAGWTVFLGVQTRHGRLMRRRVDTVRRQYRFSTLTYWQTVPSKVGAWEFVRMEYQSRTLLYVYNGQAGRYVVWKIIQTRPWQRGY